MVQALQTVRKPGTTRKKPSAPRISPRALTADDDPASPFCADLRLIRPMHEMASDVPLTRPKTKSGKVRFPL